jgi:hypothetical protein
MDTQGPFLPTVLGPIVPPGIGPGVRYETHSLLFRASGAAGVAEAPPLALGVLAAARRSAATHPSAATLDAAATVARECADWVSRRPHGCGSGSDAARCLVLIDATAAARRSAGRGIIGAVGDAVFPAAALAEPEGGTEPVRRVVVVATTDPTEFAAGIDGGLVAGAGAEEVLARRMEGELATGTRGAVGPFDPSTPVCPPGGNGDGASAAAAAHAIMGIAAARAASRSGAPLVLHFAPHDPAAVETFVRGTCAAEQLPPSRIIVTQCGLAVCADDGGAAREAVRSLAALGVVVSLDPVGCAGMWFGPIGDEIEAARDTEIAAFAAALEEAAAGGAGGRYAQNPTNLTLWRSHLIPFVFFLFFPPPPPSLVTSSTGVVSKVQLREFGGPGYGHVLDCRPRCDLGAAARGDALGPLLAWWTPPPEVARIEPTLPCSACEREFPASHAFMTKFHFRYCTPKCFKKDKPRWSTYVKKEDLSRKGGPSGGGSADGSWGIQT